MENLSRRSLLSGLAVSLVAAPFVARAGSLMKLRGTLLIGEGPCSVEGWGYVNGVLRQVIECVSESGIYTKTRWTKITYAYAASVDPGEMAKGVDYCNQATRDREWVYQDAWERSSKEYGFKPLLGLPVAFSSACFDQMSGSGLRGILGSA